MSIRSCLLHAYRLLLVFYPPPFRRRFAPEMLEVAAAAELTEWPLIFGDTSVAIVLCWLQGTRSNAALAETNAYVPLRDPPISASVFLSGLVLSIVIIAGLSYVNYKWPPPCANGVHVVIRVVAPSQVALGTVSSSQPLRAQGRSSRQ
jgi:hypothetical protein